MDDVDALWLDSDGLLSKWGFHDGDMPDAWLDWLDVAHPEVDYNADFEWHDVLRVLVRTKLLPALDQRVEVCDIETNHNPIRAERIGGADVVDQWHEVESTVTLTPDGVSVPYAEVLRVALEIGVSS